MTTQPPDRNDDNAGALHAHAINPAGMGVPDTRVFESAPGLGLQRWLGLLKEHDLNVGRRAALVVLVGWVPLILLALVQSAVLHTDGISSLLREVGAHARYLLAAPLFILAERECASRLSAIVYHFVEGGLVPEHERGRFDVAVASTRRLLCSTTAEIAVVGLAYIIALATAYATPEDQIPAWHRSGGFGPLYSPAGWWHILVSLPLLLMLILGWMSRVALWARLLWLISRIDLRLVASHPDRAAGLAFVGHSLRAFSLVAVALVTIVAGRSASVALHGGSLPISHLLNSAALLFGTAAVFIAPLLIFSSSMVIAWRRAAFEYGGLAHGMGVAFEDKWLPRRQHLDQTTLEHQDFSATTDLYQVVSNIYAMRILPIDNTSLVLLAGAMLLPYVPVVLLTVPASEVLGHLTALLF